MRETAMRRKDREVTDIKGVEEILLLCKTCHVAMVDDGAPYVNRIVLDIRTSV